MIRLRNKQPWRLEILQVVCSIFTLWRLAKTDQVIYVYNFCKLAVLAKHRIAVSELTCSASFKIQNKMLMDLKADSFFIIKGTLNADESRLSPECRKFGINY